jgi:hypothetical protein
MRIRENLSGIVAATTKRVSSSSNNRPQVGKVYAVVTTENTPTKKQFERVGGFSGIGTAFFLDYDLSKNIEGNNTDEFLDTCKTAIYFYTGVQNYPLIGELIHIIDAPAPTSQISNNASQKYYTGIVNLWNNSQLNSPSDTSLGKTFSENSDIRNLLTFEGDRIYQGRKGNGIRFGSTVKFHSDINEWSNVGNDGDPITIMVNGYITTATGSSAPNVEEINKELSSIYLTSTQKLPLIPGASIVNPRVNTIKPNNYNSSQFIANSDRITLNAKKDEVLLFAKGNIELNSDNIININAGKVAHINSPSIALGTNTDGSYPTEPVLLGNQTHDLLLELIIALRTLAGSLTTAATKDGPIVACNTAGTQLFNDVSSLIDKLSTITSEKVYTA